MVKGSAQPLTLLTLHPTTIFRHFLRDGRKLICGKLVYENACLVMLFGKVPDLKPSVDGTLICISSNLPYAVTSDSWEVSTLSSS